MRYLENYGFYVSNEKIFIIQYETKERRNAVKHLSLKIDDLIMVADSSISAIIFHIHKDSNSYKITLTLDSYEFANALLSEITDVIAEYYNSLRIT
jgi:hypothetical protein